MIFNVVSCRKQSYAGFADPAAVLASVVSVNWGRLEGSRLAFQFLSFLLTLHR